MSDALTQLDGARQNVAANGTERDWNADVNRWAKGGNDRLYIDGCKFVEYIDLDSLLVLGKGSNVDASADIDGDTLTVEIVHDDGINHKKWTATFQLPDDLAEETDDTDAAEELESELVADGGEDVTSDLSDERIEESIEKKAGTHPDAPTVEEVRDTLAAINHNVVEWWDAHQDAIDDGAHAIVHESADVIVFADVSGQFWSEQFDSMGIEKPLRSIVTSLHHSLADEHASRSWVAHYPVVVRKPQNFRVGEKHLLRTIARRTDELGTVSRAVDLLATEEFGWSKSNWARLTGRNPSTVTRTTDN